MPRRNKREQRMRPEEAKFWRDKKKKEEDEDGAKHAHRTTTSALSAKRVQRKIR